MPTANLSLAAAESLYRYAEGVMAGRIDAGEMRNGFIEIHEQLKPACEQIPTWEQRGLCMKMAGPGWMLSYRIASDTDEPETALIDRATGEFHMLAGDHRAEYEAVASGGLPALLDVFRKLKVQFPHVGW